MAYRSKKDKAKYDQVYNRRYKLRRRAYQKAWYRKNKKRVAARVREYYLHHKKELSEYNKRWRKENKARLYRLQETWRKKHPDRVRGYALKRMYGIDYEQFLRMLKRQRNRCAICGTTSPNGRGFQLDHHPKKGPRGVLCFSCNVALGHFRHDARILNKAAIYLRGKR